MNKRISILFVGCLFLSVVIGWATEPVKHKSQGCVINGKAYSLYDASTVYRYELPKTFNLKPYEGKKVELEGMLSPGDYFVPKGKEFKVLGPCDSKSKELIKKIADK
jgi:hypothetical protein